MTVADVVALVIGELALFAGVGFFLFALDDLAVDLIFFVRRTWRSRTVYRRFARTDAAALDAGTADGPLVLFIPAWDESAVIAAMLRHTLATLEHADYRLYVGHYRNDPATAAAIASVTDDRIRRVCVDADGPTTKGDCLNHLYAALTADEAAGGWRAKGVVFHDAEDVVHPLELRLFDRLLDRATLIQLPVVPLLDPHSRWVAGHYADEFAESHGKELVVREALGASIPLAGVGCAVERGALATVANLHGGRPFAAASMTEDYELGLRLGAMGARSLFVRLPERRGAPAMVASRGHFPSELDAAVRQKARWIGGIALAGWDRLGWRGGWGERWFRMRDRRGPLAALVMTAGYVAALLWSNLALAHQFGVAASFTPSPLLTFLLAANLVLLAWRVAMRFAFTAATYGWREGLWAIPRIPVANLILIMAAVRALRLHRGGGPRQWDKTDHVFPAELAA